MSTPDRFRWLEELFDETRVAGTFRRRERKVSVQSEARILWSDDERFIVVDRTCWSVDRGENPKWLPVAKREFVDGLRDRSTAVRAATLLADEWHAHVRLSLKTRTLSPPAPAVELPADLLGDPS